MLYTNLKHIETAVDQEQAVGQNENVVIVCGRMEPASVAIYRKAEELEKEFSHVIFFDMEFDNPESGALKNTMEYYDIAEIPVIGFFRQGNLVNVTFGIEAAEKFEGLVRKEFTVPVNA